MYDIHRNKVIIKLHTFLFFYKSKKKVNSTNILPIFTHIKLNQQRLYVISFVVNTIYNEFHRDNNLCLD
jgi:hypothetical protein